MILESGKEIVELEKSGFKTDEATICAGNIGLIFDEETNKSFPMTYQVLPNSVLLLNGSQLLEHLRLESNFPVVQSSSASKYILLRTEFEIFLIEILDQPKFDNENNQNSYMSITKPNQSNNTPIVSFCLYHDKTGFIGQALNPIEEEDDFFIPADNEVARSTNLEWTNEVDYVLYGGSSAFVDKMISDPVEPMSMESPDIPDDPEEQDKYLYGDKSVDDKDHLKLSNELDNDNSGDGAFRRPIINESHIKTWAFILYNDGNLEIYSVPDFELHFRTNNFFDSPSLLLNLLKVPNLADIQSSYHNTPITVDFDQKFEIVVCNIGRNKDRPVIFARNSDEVALYEILPPVTRRCRYIDELGDHMRMKKIPISCLLRPVKKAKDDAKLSELYRNLSSRNTLMKPFENIRGFRGLFISGSYPTWLFFTKDGHIRSYPMYVEGVVSCFATNPCPDAQSADFAYFNNRGEMKLLNLPMGYDYEYQKAVKRISMNRSVHFIQYHIDSKTFAVITSVDTYVMSIYKLNNENSKEREDIERDPDIPRAPLSNYTLQFYANESNGDWDPVPQAKVVFEEWDKVSCMTTVQLFSQMTYSGTKDFLAVGSNMSYGEEIPVRGKIMIVDIIDVVPEPGQVLTRHKMKIIYDTEQKGPVTALASCKGYLVSAIGQKMYIWELKDNELVGVAFVDSEIYVHQLLCVRNLILTGDYLKSVQLLRFQSDLRVLSLVSKDSQARGVTCSNFFVDNENLGFMMADNNSNIIIFSYNPLVEESRNGKQFVRNADMKLPIIVTCSLRINDRIRDPILYSTHSVGLSQDLLRQSVYFGSASGAIVRLSPISNRQLIQMKLTEKNLSQCLHHYGGLHPKASRQYKFTRPELSNACGNVADGDLLSQYATLPYSQRTEIAKKAGVEIDKILDDLTDIYSSTLHF